MDTAPLRIECFDVSNLHGTDVVASMVVFEDGLPRKSEYRRFGVRSVGTAAGDGPATANDVAAIAEVVRRRFSRYVEERQATGELDVAEDPGDIGGDGSLARPAAIDPVTGRARRFAYPPNLVVVD